MKNEVRPIDVNELERKIREYMRSLPASTARIMEYHKVLSMLGDEGQTPTLQLGCNIAATGEPLTLEQLREMDGKPVWVKVIGKTGIRCDGWCEVEIREKDPFAYVGWPGSEVEDIAKIEDYGKTWACYAYPSAHIDREAWEPCEFCGKADFGEYGFEIGRSYVKIACALGSWRFPTEEQFHFCPKCGRPLTEKAWAELEKRLRG